MLHVIHGTVIRITLHIFYNTKSHCVHRKRCDLASLLRFLIIFYIIITLNDYFFFVYNHK